MLRGLKVMWSQHCYSRVLKKNIGGKWVKYIINKTLKIAEEVVTIFNKV